MSVFVTLQKAKKWAFGLKGFISPWLQTEIALFSRLPGTYGRYPRMWHNYEAIKQTANPQTQAAVTRTGGEVQDHVKGSRPPRRKMSKIKPWKEREEKNTASMFLFQATLFEQTLPMKTSKHGLEKFKNKSSKQWEAASLVGTYQAKAESRH